MQHDMNIANQGFPAFRADLNDALVALVSNNSGASAPATTFANMPWYDTTNNIFKIRNEDNDAWISVFTLDQTTDAITAIGSVTLADVVSLTGTQTLTNKTLTNPILTNPTVDKITTGVSGAIIGAGNSSLMKNRIINGAMVIDQRNAGASVTPSADTYTVDRWKYEASQASKFTIQQNKGSVTPPVGFTNYLGFSTASAVSVGATDYFLCEQYIEGFNVADLGWGTANAKTVTLSFQVYSSLTGTFGGNLQNNANNRFYPFSYSIPVANTWTTISVTIAGDTTGTWITNNGTGILLRFSLGTGSTYLGTAGSWGSTTYVGVTGQTNVVGTLNATFYITAVQLEVGSSQTGYEYRNYQQELALCQRYYQTYTQPELRGVVNGASSAGRCGMVLPVVMRTAPTCTAGTLYIFDGSASATTTSGINATYSTASCLEFDFTTSGGLTVGRPAVFYQNGTGVLTCSAEL